MGRVPSLRGTTQDNRKVAVNLICVTCPDPPLNLSRRISDGPCYSESVVKAHASFPLDVLFRALADPTRLRLLNLIAGRDLCVCYFVEILRISQPKVSRHLSYLRRAGIVAARREGKWVHYRLVIPQDEVAEGILRATLKYLANKPEM